MPWSYLARDEKGSENEKRLREGSEKREIFEQKIFREMKCNKGSSNGQMDGTMHWSKGPTKTAYYGTTIESWMMSFEKKENVFSFLVFITQFFE